MASAAWKKYNSTVVVGTSATVSTTTQTGGDVVLDAVSASGNAEGCAEAEVYATVTAAATETYLQLWIETSDDGTNYTKTRYSRNNGEGTFSGANRLTFGNIPLSKYTKMYLVSPTATCTASLNAIPFYYEGQ
jgi:hypothetical protein